MIVISRCLNTSIRIGENIKVKVLRLGQRRVTLGIDAPSGIPTRRDELCEEKSAAQSEASPELTTKILVVEDTPVHAILIERALMSQGIKQITRTSNGEDALRVLSVIRESGKEELLPDLVLLDIQLPGISGLHVLETIKSIFKHRIPVVVFSSSEDFYERAMSAGANAFVAKSDSYDEFRKRILSIVNFWCKTHGPTP